MKLYWVISFLLFCCVASAQQPSIVFKNYNTRDGLPSNNISEIFQDSEGFIWIGTREGISKFDSKRFYNYQLSTDSIFKNINRNNQIHSIFEDTCKNIWIGTARGVFIFNSKTHSIKWFNEIPGDSSSLGNRTVYNIQIDSFNKIWLGTYKSIDLAFPEYNSYGEIEHISFRHYFTKNNLFPSRNARLSSGKLLYFTYPNGHFIINPEDKSISTLSDEFGVEIDQKTRLLDILEKDTLLYITTWSQGLIIVDKKTKTIQKQFFGDQKSRNELGHIVEVDDSRLLIGTQEGVLIYNVFTQTYKLYTSDVSFGSLSQNIIGDILKDRDGGIWIGTAAHGINYLYPRSHNFSKIEYDFEDGILPHYGVNSFDIAGDKLYMSTGNGVACFDLKTKKKLSHYLKDSPYGSDIKKIICVNQNVLLCYGYSLLYFYDVSKSKVIVPEYLLPISRKYTSELYLHTNGQVYVASQNDSLFVFLPSLQNSTEFRWFGDKKSYVKFFQDNSGYLWVVSREGLYKCQSEKNPVGSEGDLIPFPDGYRGLDLSSVDDVCVTAGNKFWFATDHGILIFNPLDKNFEILSVKHGLPSNVIHSFQEDSKGYMWISTSFGLARYNPNTKYINVFYKEEGLPSNIFLVGSSIQDTLGNMYFGTDHGFIWFKPEQIMLNEKMPEIVFTDFKISNILVEIGGKSPLKADINYVSEIVLSHKQSDITIAWSALNYYLPEKNRFEYRLVGYTDDWSPKGNKHEVNYASLAPGKYSFEVRGSNNDGMWNFDGRTIRIVVRPPYWKTWVFRILVVFGVLLLGVVLYGVKVRNLRRRQIVLERQVKERTAEVEAQKEELQVQSDNLSEVNQLLKERQEEVETQAQNLHQLNATKDKFFSIIAHDLKNPFQGITGFADILHKRLQDNPDQELKEFASIISDTSKGAYSLLENLLNWSRSQTNQIIFQPEFFDLCEIVDQNIKILSLVANGKGIELASRIQKNTIAWADPNMISTIVRNLMNNAIKFTDTNGRVTVSKKEETGFVVIDIVDTGIGMEPSVVNKLFKIEEQISKKGTQGESGTGLGLIICQEFIQKNNGVIKVQSAPGKGSAFSIYIPEKEGVSTKEIMREIVNNNTKKKQQLVEQDMDKDDFPEVENTAGMRVLVVEDDNNIRYTIVSALKEMYEIFEAENGEEGMKKALEIIPDLIISDVMMPEMDGFQLSQKIKSDQLTSHIPFILLTAKISDKSQLEGLKSGADDYLTKPFDNKILRYKIRNVLSTRENLKKKFLQSHSFSIEILSLTSKDEEFIDKFCAYLDENIENPDISVGAISNYMGMSRGHLYRKVMGVSGLSPQDFIRVFRLKRAAELLSNTQLLAKEVSYKVGFTNPNYFYRAFKDHFKLSTSEFVKKNLDG